MTLRRKLGRRIPPIGRRDATIRDLQRQLRRADAKRPPAPGTADPPDAAQRLAARHLEDNRRVADQPSWLVQLRSYNRVDAGDAGDRLRPASPRSLLTLKLHNYEFARSHPVPTPRVVGVWPTLDEVPWAELPERFVLKSNGGAAGGGPLCQPGLRHPLPENH